MKRKNIIIWPALLVLLLIISVVIFDEHRVTADAIIVQENGNSNIIQPITNIDNSNTNTALNNNSPDSIIHNSKFIIPILMYHHIREYNNTDDQIGTNLSVTPTEFAAQLDLIKDRGYTTISFADVLSGNVPEKSIILTFDDGYENFYQNAYLELLKRSMKAVSYIIVNDVGGGDYMTRDQIVEVEKNGIEIGSHTLSHPNLAKASDTKATKEITESKKYLEDLLGKKIISFCYPSGKYTATTEKIVKDSGYEFAVTTKGGVTSFTDYFALNRYRINNGTSISGWIK